MTDAITHMLNNGQKDLFWFNENLETLKQEYDNQFIAFQNREVIASAPDIDDLLKKIEKKDMSSILIRFVSKVKSIL